MYPAWTVDDAHDLIVIQPAVSLHSAGCTAAQVLTEPPADPGFLSEVMRASRPLRRTPSAHPPVGRVRRTVVSTAGDTGG